MENFLKSPQIQPKLVFIARINPNTALFEKLENILANKLIQALLKNTFRKKLRRLFSLPVIDGGLNLTLTEDQINKSSISTIIVH